MPPSPYYNQQLDFSPTFKWGGREWGANDQDAFIRAMGSKRYKKWLRRHPTAGRVFDPVEQQIYSAYGPQLNAMNREREMERARYDRLMRNLGGFAGALGPLLAGGPGAVRGAYDNAAATMLSGGAMYGGQLNADQAANAASNNALLNAIGAPEGAQQSGGDAGGVLAGAAGWIPATMMGEQGAAWGDRMAHFPTEAALQANLMMKGLMEDAVNADKEYGSQITDVLGGIAADRAKLKSGYESDRFKQRMEMLKFQADMHYRNYLIALKQGDQKRANKEYQLAVRKQKQAEMESNREYNLDVRKENRYDREGRAKAAGGGVTTAQARDSLKDVVGSEEAIREAVVNAVKGGKWTPTAGRSKERRALVNQLFNDFKHLALTKAARARLKRIIMQAVTEAGRLGPPAPGTSAASGGGGGWADFLEEG